MTNSTGPWPGRFVWFDLMTTDAGKSQAFYEALFGWQIQEVPMQGFTYRMIVCGPGAIGGIVEEKAIPVSHWMPYVGTPDVDASAETVTATGGSVCVPPTDIPQTGRFAVVSDPTGAYFSLFQALPGSEGADPDQMVPGRVCWTEVYTTDIDAAQDFYSGLLGWEPQKRDMGEAGMYHTQMLGDKMAAGMMKVPMPGMPSCWAVYFFAPDLDAAGARAKELGATALHEGVPIPEVGRFSMFQDPAGAMFSLFEPLAAPDGAPGDA
jgi:predicted enzyme related to lactoylglutathione lyase